MTKNCCRKKRLEVVGKSIESGQNQFIDFRSEFSMQNRTFLVFSLYHVVYLSFFKSVVFPSNLIKEFYHHNANQNMSENFKKTHLYKNVFF